MGFEYRADHFHRRAAFGQVAEWLAIFMDAADEIRCRRDVIVHGLHGNRLGFFLAGAAGCEGDPRPRFARGAPKRKSSSSILRSIKLW